MVTACLKVGIEVEWRDRGSNLAGSVQRIPDRIPTFHLLLNLKHTEAQQFGTLAHELGHVFCGHLGRSEDAFWPDRRYATTTAREFEAEAVAYLIAQRCNLDIGSVSYLAGYLKTDSLPKYSLETILKAVSEIEKMMQGRFRLKKKPKDTKP